MRNRQYSDAGCAFFHMTTIAVRKLMVVAVTSRRLPRVLRAVSFLRNSRGG